MRELDKKAIGMRIRRLRERRGLTQRELADAAGLGESALRNYELGARAPKERQIESLAKALRVRPEAFEVTGIETDLQLIHALFNLEDRFGVAPHGGGVPSLDAGRGGLLCKALLDWGRMLDLLKSGEIGRDEYEEWKDTYNPTILIDRSGSELPDPYTGKMLEGRDREGAEIALVAHPELL